MSDDLDRKKERLVRILKSHGRSLVAVSGGIDSRFLYSMCRELDLEAEAVFFSGPHQTGREIKRALSWLERNAPVVHHLEHDPLSIPEAAVNDRRRCYWCKLSMFRRAVVLAQDRGMTTVMDGTQADDLTVYRPGREALLELRIASPLAEAGLRKSEIRSLAGEYLGLADADQPARPCLLTRFSYGIKPSRDMLEMIDRAETLLFESGLTEFRIRIIDQEQAILQIDRKDRGMWETVNIDILEKIDRIGLTFSNTVFTRGVSGYFDQHQAEDK